MDVILLERVAKLGQMGEVVSVKEGYARNFLLPQGKALRANNATLPVSKRKKRSLKRPTSKPAKKPNPSAKSSTVRPSL